MVHTFFKREKKVSIIKERIFTPVFIFVKTVLGHSGTPFDEANGFYPAGITGAPYVLVKTFEAQGINTRLGPVIEQGEGPFKWPLGIKVQRFPDLYTVEKRPVDASVLRSLSSYFQPQGVGWLGAKR